jgi:hypothetical protein
MLLQVNLIAILMLTIVVVYQFVVMTSTTTKAGEALEKANRIMKVIHLKTQDELDELAQKTDSRFNELNTRVSAKEICVDGVCIRKEDIISLKNQIGTMMPSSQNDIINTQQEVQKEEPSDAVNTIKYNLFNRGFLPSDVLKRPYCCVDADNRYLRHSEQCETLKAQCAGKLQNTCINDTFGDFCEWKNNTCVNREKAPVFTARVPCDEPDTNEFRSLVQTTPSTPKPIFYTEFDQKGATAQLGIGEYRDLSATHPFLFNSIKSFQLNKDWTVTFYTGKNFTGYSARFKYPTKYNLVALFAGKVKSMNITRLTTYEPVVTPEIPAKNVTQNSTVRLFTGRNQTGDYIDLGPENYGDLEKIVPKLFNNIKSLVLPEDIEITFYKGKNFASSTLKFSYPASYNLGEIVPFEEVGSLSVKRKPLLPIG